MKRHKNAAWPKNKDDIINPDRRAIHKCLLFLIASGRFSSDLGERKNKGENHL